MGFKQLPADNGKSAICTKEEYIKHGLPMHSTLCFNCKKTEVFLQESSKQKVTDMTVGDIDVRF